MTTPELPTSTEDVADIRVGTAFGLPVVAMSDSYRPASGDKMAEDIIAAFREHAPRVIHPDYDPGYDS